MRGLWGESIEEGDPAHGPVIDRVLCAARRRKAEGQEEWAANASADGPDASLGRRTAERAVLIL